METIGVAFITHCAYDHLPRCLPPVLQSPLKPKVYVVNSSSNDGTVERAQEFGVETLVIPRKQFNHGATRELARKALDTDIIVMMTPDAYLVDSSMLESLVAPIAQGKAAAAYAQQILHDGAGFFESFSRAFNYPAQSHIRSINDVDTFGIYTFFFSDSCGAYSNQALDSIGGFTPVLIGEDTVACAKLLKAGLSIAYVSEAKVKHSHRYTLKQEFQRFFDTGLARRNYGDLLAFGGKDESRGKEYALALFRQILKERPTLLPYALLQTAAKWIGYKMGRMSDPFSKRWKKFFSAQKYYWQ